VSYPKKKEIKKRNRINSGNKNSENKRMYMQLNFDN